MFDSIARNEANLKAMAILISAQRKKIAENKVGHGHLLTTTSHTFAIIARSRELSNYWLRCMLLYLRRNNLNFRFCTGNCGEDEGLECQERANSQRE